MSARQRALGKKEEQEALRAQKAQEEAERAEAASWSQGAKDSKKQKEAEDRDAEKKQKAAEKAALLAAEEAELSGIKRTAKPAKKKGPDDFKFLQAALASQPKTKAQKEQEERQKQEAERKRKEEENRAARLEKEKKEEEERKKLLAKGIVANHAEELMVPINNRRTEDDFDHGTGIDAAIDVMSLGPSGKADMFPEKRQKALYNAYYERMLPVIKEEQPGLRLTQYQDRIFNMWKTAPENPMAGKR